MGNYIPTNHRLACGGTTHTSSEVKPPLYYCYSCASFCNNRCNFFKRPVKARYNKCFHHSFYSPIAAIFREPANLDEIIQAEEEKNCLI